VGLSFSEISDLLQDRAAMKVGKIRTKEKCPVCGSLFIEVPRTGLECPVHKTRPRRFFVDLWWKEAQIKIYSDKNDQILSSWDQAYLCLALINKEIKEGFFDSSKYVRKDKSQFWLSTLIGKFHKFKIPQIAPSYQTNYRIMVDSAKAFFKNQDVREIRKLDLEKYKIHLEERGTRGKTLKNYLDLFRVFLNDCCDRLEILDRVPKLPDVDVPDPQFRWLEAEDQQKIWAFIPIADRPIFDFMALHGCRPGEARALRVKDVDLRSGTVAISSTWSGKELRERRKGRRAKPVTLPIHPEMIEFVGGRAKSALPGAFLFINPRTDRVYSQNRLRKIWDRVKIKAGITGIRLYDATRHSFASQLVNAGEDLDRVRELLGHTSIKTTQKYAHHSIEGKKAALKKLSLRKIVDYPQTSPGAKIEIKAQ
jgi:integrase